MTCTKPENLWLLKLLQSSSVFLEMYCSPPPIWGIYVETLQTYFSFPELKSRTIHTWWSCQCWVIFLLPLFVLQWDSCREFYSPWNYWFFFSTWDKGQGAALIWKSIPQLEPGGSTPHSTPSTQAKCQPLPARLCCCHSFLFCNVQTPGDVAGCICLGLG